MALPSSIILSPQPKVPVLPGFLPGLFGFPLPGGCLYRHRQLHPDPFAFLWHV